MSELTMTFVDEYQAGACNIGPQEIARRRWAGHIGTAVTLIAAALLIGFDAPWWVRLALFVPASGAAAGYIQAAMRFCADYGWRGVFNFGEAGRDAAISVAEADGRRADRRRALAIGAASAAIGSVVAIAAALL